MSSESLPAPLHQLVGRVLMFPVFLISVLVSACIGILSYPIIGMIVFFWSCYIGRVHDRRYNYDPLDLALYVGRKLRTTDNDAIPPNPQVCGHDPQEIQ
jgi:hypothetical protein